MVSFPSQVRDVEVSNNKIETTQQAEMAICKGSSLE